MRFSNDLSDCEGNILAARILGAQSSHWPSNGLVELPRGMVAWWPPTPGRLAAGFGGYNAALPRRQLFECHFQR